MCGGRTFSPGIISESGDDDSEKRERRKENEDKGKEKK